jgi:hypothetical protein
MENNNEIIIPETTLEENKENIKDTNEDNQKSNSNNHQMLNKDIIINAIKTLKEKKKKDNNTNKLKLKLKRDRKPLTNYIRLSTGEQLHFNESENHKYPLVLNKIIKNGIVQNIIRRIPSNIHKRILYLSKFILSDDVSESSYLYYKNISDTIYYYYIIEYKLRYIFKRLLLLWRAYKLNKKYVVRPDPVTLSDIEKPIVIYNWELKQKFIFDAKSLANGINANLLYYENGFSCPQDPKNLITNTPFLYKELVSIYYQLQKAGEAKWALCSLREYNFNKRVWEFYNKPQLYTNSIKNEINRLDTYDGRELFIDFVISRLEEYGLNSSEYVVSIYQKGIVYYPTHYYIQMLKPIVILYYESEYFKINKCNTIKNAFLNVYKNESKFIRDMISHGFI